MSAIELLEIALHETYPGHHAERCCKEHHLVREQGLLEETIVLVPTPQSLVAEGIATTAPQLLLRTEAGATLAGIVADAGIELDLPQALAIERAAEARDRAIVNAGVMLHEQGAEQAEVRAYLEAWGLMGEDLSAHLTRFLEEPSSRTYPITYAAGRQLCRAYVADQPQRFCELLTRQTRVGDLVAASAGTGAVDRFLPAP
jgi:hypothetical protein